MYSNDVLTEQLMTVLKCHIELLEETLKKLEVNDPLLPNTEDMRPLQDSLLKTLNLVREFCSFARLCRSENSTSLICLSTKLNFEYEILLKSVTHDAERGFAVINFVLVDRLEAHKRTIINILSAVGDSASASLRN